MTPKTTVATGKIVKLDEDKHLVFGWASIIKDVDGKILLDRQNDYIDSEEELENAAYDYVLKSRNGGEMHIRRGVSKMVESVVLTEEKQRMLGIPTGSTPTGWWIGFKVNDNRVWEQVKKGEYAGFSVHGTGRRESTELPFSKFTEVGKGDFAGHPFRGNQYTRGTGGAGKGKAKRVTARSGPDGSKSKVAIVMTEHPTKGKLAVIRDGTNGALYTARILGVSKKNKTFTAETVDTSGFYQDDIPYGQFIGMVAGMGKSPKRPNIKRAYEIF